MDLQLFAQERTEEATPRRLRKAREEGQAPRSADLITGAGLAAAATALKSLGPGFYELIARGMSDALSSLKLDLTPDTVAGLIQTWGLLYIKAVLPLTGIILAVGVGLGLLQTQFLFSLKAIAPDFKRINPGAGFQRIFSMNTVVELIKGLAKIGIVGYVAYRNIITGLPSAPRLMDQSVAQGIVTIAGSAVSALQTIGLALLALGAADYGYQYWRFLQSVRMTKQEVKQEFREQEGSPELKSKQRAKQRELARRRKAIKDVPTADVVITNPTHFAVAIKYAPEENEAPKVIAKGADLLAQRIKVIAKQSGVPTMENKPLARALYNTVDVGKTIPPELYQAVAEVLAVVYGQRRHERHEWSPT